MRTSRALQFYEGEVDAEDVLNRACESCEYIEEIPDDRPRPEASAESLDAIDVALEMSSLLLHRAVIDKIEATNKSRARTWNHSREYMTDQIAEARERLETAYLIYSHLKRDGVLSEVQLRMRCDRSRHELKKILDLMTHFDIVRRTELNDRTEFTLTTRVWAECSAMCPRCGTVAKAAKYVFLEPMYCRKCARPVDFILLPEDQGQ